ncbi:MAG: signal peptide peptidase SppA [Syntrophobacteraceae bacterium]
MKVMNGCLVVLLVLAGIVGAVAWYFSDIELSVKNNRVGVVEVKGTITNSQETVKQLKEFRKDSSVKAIIVRIDSPGGAVGPSQEVYTEIRRTIQSKPVVASLGSVAASGGYYIASAANTIVANAGTITGSIGVIIYFPNLRELFEKIGYQMTTVKSGQFKDIGNPSREMTPEERELIQGTIDETYSQFVRDVARARNLPEEQVRKVADGRIILGEKARELKLVDQLGNFEDAVAKAAELGKIEGDPEITYAKKTKRSVMDLLLGSDVSEKLNDVIYDSSAFLRYQLPDFAR